MTDATAHKRMKRPRVIAALLVSVALALWLWPTYTWSPISQLQVRSELRTAFPGFRLVELRGHNEPPLANFPDGAQLNFYTFVLESDRTPAFQLEGGYPLTNLGNVREDQRELQTTIFNGTALDDQELGALEALWIRDYPSERIAVGPGRLTGPVTPWWDDLRRSVEESALAGLDPDEIYIIDSTPGERRFFRLDSTNGQWEHLPGLNTP